MAHIPFDHATLDPFTEERLLSGTVHPDDLPPTLGRVAGLLHSARAGALLDPELEQDKERGVAGSDKERGAAAHDKERALTRELEQISAMVMILSGQPAAALTPAGAHRPRVLRRAKIVAAVFAATLVIGSGLAFAGALPGGAQDAAAKMFAKLGITVPRHDKGSQSTKPGPGPDVTGPAKFGLCQAFSSGQGGQNGNKDNAVPFQNLQKAATAAGQTVDQFCAGATPGGKAQSGQGSSANQGKAGSHGKSGNAGAGNGNAKGHDNGAGTPSQGNGHAKATSGQSGS